MSKRTSQWQVMRCALGMVLACCFATQAAQDKREPLRRAEELAEHGKFSEAERLLREHIADPKAPVIDEYAVALEIIRRIRLDYSLTPVQMLTKLRRSIADVSAEDLERWRQQGVLQHRMIDDEVRYFGREPSNLFRLCEEAKSRQRADVKPAGGRFDLPEHIRSSTAFAMSCV